MIALASCSSPAVFHILPESRIMAGIEASTMTSLGTCRLVMPLSELTMARAGRSAYRAWMSASISACLSAGRSLMRAYRSPIPLLALKPTSARAAACLASTSL
ncbi:hypothetical protein D3C79_816690 [compost metagenome]